MMKPAVDRLVAPAAKPSSLMGLVGGFADAAAVEVSGPAGESVPRAVFGERHEFKVLNAVVGLVAVLVMNALVGFEFPPEVLRHDVTVFGDSRSVRQPELDIASRVDPPAAVEPLGPLARPVCGTTRDSAVNGGAAAELPGVNLKLLPALAAISGGEPLSVFGPARHGTGASPVSLRRLNVERLATDLAGDGFHAPIVHGESSIAMSVTAKTFTYDDADEPTSITETT